MPLEFGDEIWRQKTRMVRLSYGEEIIIVGQTMYAQSTSMTDRQIYRYDDRDGAMHSVAR